MCDEDDVAKLVADLLPDTLMNKVICAAKIALLLLFLSVLPLT